MEVWVPLGTAADEQSVAAGLSTPASDLHVPGQGRLYGPDSMAVSESGEIFVLDGFGSRVRRIAGHRLSTIAGCSTPGFKDGSALEGAFKYARSLAADEHGNIFIADTANNRIRLLGGGKVSTLAGSGENGLLDCASGGKPSLPVRVVLRWTPAAPFTFATLETTAFGRFH